MITLPNQLIASFPLIIIGFTILIVLISISVKRNHFFIALVTSINLGFSLLSLYFVNKVSEIKIMSLLYIDNYSIFYIALIIISSLSTCIFAYIWLSKFLDHKEEFYLLILISSLGGIILSSTNNFVTLFLGIELLSLPLFGLIGYNFYKKISLEASIKYTILSTVASSFLLFGIALVYSESGSLNYIVIGKRFTSDLLIYKPLFLVGFCMIITSLGFKLSLVPFHLWTPDVYQGAPTSISCFLSTVSKMSIFSTITKLFIYIPITNSIIIANILIIIAFMSIIFGNIMAVFQTNIKRLLGYSSISHIGYLLISLITIKQNQLSLESSGIYMIGYLFSNLGIFGIIILISKIYDKDDSDIDDNFMNYYRGLFWYDPYLCLVMTIMLLSLAGIPITLGFIGKFYIISISIMTHLWWLVGGILISSIIGVYYYLRIILNLYMIPLKTNQKIISNDCCLKPIKITLFLYSTLTIMLGIYPQPLIDLILSIHPRMYY
ncbi:NADH-quinone oxidoreductase subunit NuoN [Candidatus Pantoea edessiphila]|uniref:NADH-quinone oxidoreductase subunit N n=1 Tax=Candidatus Pantoea edessiphila TaxID=2044610 RepID=A0A2P5SWM0_9GAMM|nr:NADH-quinone oxidoreductase subunit NuoN [Candidatus Pantoea edessiphila]PPI86729.1 NADH-quinone oxidoreductase subunit NuoN [Candidatus Pantoea edessiphila]